MEHVADVAVHKELKYSLVRASTTTSSLEAEQDSGNINKTQSKATPNESSFQGTNSGGGPRCQEAMRDTTAQTRFESVSKHSNDSLLVRVNDAHDSAATTTISTEELTLAQALEALKTSKPKVKGIVIQEQEESDEEEVAIDAIRLAVKSPRIVDWKIHKEGKKRYYQIMRAAGKSQMYMFFGQMLKSFDREDLEDLYKLDAIYADLHVDEEEVAIDAIRLAVKSPRIVDWKIHKEGKKRYYQIMRAAGKSQMYMFFGQMLKSFDREDLEDLYKLVKARYGSTRLVDNMDYLL
nr:hypothetical protein [Tanacetum cinerariifolium]